MVNLPFPQLQALIQGTLLSDRLMLPYCLCVLILLIYVTLTLHWTYLQKFSQSKQG